MRAILEYQAPFPYPLGFCHRPASRSHTRPPPRSPFPNSKASSADFPEKCVPYLPREALFLRGAVIPKLEQPTIRHQIQGGFLRC